MSQQLNRRTQTTTPPPRRTAGDGTPDRVLLADLAQLEDLARVRRRWRFALDDLEQHISEIEGALAANRAERRQKSTPERRC